VDDTEVVGGGEGGGHLRQLADAGRDRTSGELDGQADAAAAVVVETAHGRHAQGVQSAEGLALGEQIGAAGRVVAAGDPDETQLAVQQLDRRSHHHDMKVHEEQRDATRRRSSVDDIDEIDDIDDPVLVRLLDEARLAAAVDERREHWFAGLASAEETTATGLLVTLAEAREPVSVRMVSGRTHSGVVRLVGTDVTALATASGTAWLRTSAVSEIRAPGAAVPHGGTAEGLDVAFGDVLSLLAGERPEVVVVTSAGASLRGRLDLAGVDIVGLVRPPGRVYVPVAAVHELLAAD
jgi:DNA-binding IclR family transcriptional regulator